MSMRLPPVIHAYFDAEKSRDAEAASRRFAKTAIVRDDGESYVGRDSIQKWMADSIEKHACTVEPFSVADDGSRIIVISHVAGEFPGSPVDLRYFFILENDRIVDLEIVL